MTSFKLKLMALSVATLFLATPNPAIAQNCVCGNINGDSIRDIDDLVLLIDLLLGVPMQVDTLCAGIDGDKEITLNDLMVFWDQTFITNGAPWGGCDTTRSLAYPISTVDTIFFPGAVEINVGRSFVDLPVFASYAQNAIFTGAYIPLLTQGIGSDSMFSITDIRSGGVFSSGLLQGSRIGVAGDTSVLIYIKQSPEPVEQIASLEYSRTQVGPGNIVPEIVSSVLERRMVISDWPVWRSDPQVPQIKTYTPSPCCSAGAGNVDCDPNDITDITDLTVLIDHLFINFPPLCCPSEANIDLDTDGRVDISDLTKLIDHLFINFPPLQSCQRPFLDD